MQMNSFRETIHFVNRNLVRVTFILLFLFVISSIQSYASMNESEPNDSAMRANTIRFGQSIYGSSGDYNRDWFKFTAPATGSVKISIWCDGAEMYPDRVHAISADVYDSDQNDVAYNIFDRQDTSSPGASTFGVKGGQLYYVRVRNDSVYYNTYYHFVLEYTKPTGKIIIRNTIANSARKTNTVVWDKSKIRGANGYEINWKARGASKWASRKVGNVTRGDTSGLTIGGLYEIRVRPYLSLNSGSYVVYGSWSPTVYRYFYTTQRIRLASKSKGSFTMSWARDSRASGYQVLYTTNKNGAGAANNIKSVGPLASSITVRDIKVNGKTTRLQSGRTYYVQVREYRKIGSITYYGNISCPVAVKVK